MCVCVRERDRERESCVCARYNVCVCVCVCSYASMRVCQCVCARVRARACVCVTHYALHVIILALNCIIQQVVCAAILTPARQSRENIWKPRGLFKDISHDKARPVQNYRLFNVWHVTEIQYGFTHTHTHTHSLFLSDSLSHTHTHTL